MIKNVQMFKYEDSDIVRGIEYKYEIEAVDQFGLVSNRTKPAMLVMPKLEEKSERQPSQNATK